MTNKAVHRVLRMQMDAMDTLSKRTHRAEIASRPSRSAMAWSGAISTFLTLPALRGFWPMSVWDENGQAIDLSGQGRHLTRGGAGVINQALSVGGLATYYAMDNARYLYRADEAGLDILGTEAYVISSMRGLTIGAWIRPTTPSAADDGIIGKWTTTTPQRSYLLWRNNVDSCFRFGVSTNGAGGVSDTSTINASVGYTLDKFHFVVGRFTPGTAVSIWVDGVKASNTTSIHSTIFNSTAPLTIGSYNTSLGTWTHQQAFCFLCASAVRDDVINALFENTRGIFGV